MLPSLRVLVFSYPTPHPHSDNTIHNGGARRAGMTSDADDRMSRLEHRVMQLERMVDTLLERTRPMRLDTDISQAIDEAEQTTLTDFNF